jgi:fatty acid desaturase
VNDEDYDDGGAGRWVLIAVGAVVVMLGIVFAPALVFVVSAMVIVGFCVLFLSAITDEDRYERAKDLIRQLMPWAE